MAVSGNNLLDPSVCSCFSGSYQYNICNKIKWSTLSITAALLIIVINKLMINLKECFSLYVYRLLI